MPPSLGLGFNMKSIIEHDRWLKNLASRPPLKATGGAMSGGRNTRAREEDINKPKTKAYKVNKASSKTDKQEKTDQKGFWGKPVSGEQSFKEGMLKKNSSFEETIENTIKTEARRVVDRVASSNMETKKLFYRNPAAENQDKSFNDTSVSFGKTNYNANDMQTILINNFLFAKETLKNQQMFPLKQSQMEVTKKNVEIWNGRETEGLRKGDGKPIPGSMQYEALNLRDISARKIQRKFRAIKARKERSKMRAALNFDRIEIEGFAGFEESQGSDDPINRKKDFLTFPEKIPSKEIQVEGYLNRADEKLIRKREKKAKKEQEYQANKLRVQLIDNKPKPYKVPSDNLSIVGLFKKKNPGRLFQIVRNQEGELKEVSSEIVTEEQESDEALLANLKDKYKNNNNHSQPSHRSKGKASADSSVHTELNSSEQEKSGERKRDIRGSRYSSVRESIYEEKDMNASSVSENIAESISAEDKQISESIRESMQYHSSSNHTIKEESNLMASKVKDGSIDEEIPMSNSYVYDEEKFESISSEKAASRSFGKKDNIFRQSNISSSKGESFGGGAGFKKSVTFEEHSMNTEEVGVLAKPKEPSGPEFVFVDRQKISEELLKEEKEIFEIKSELLTILKQMNANRFKYEPEYLFKSIQPSNPSALADMLFSKLQLEIASANHAKIVNNQLDNFEKRFDRLNTQAEIIKSGKFHENLRGSSEGQHRIERTVRNIETKQEVIMKTLLMMMDKIQETKNLKEQLTDIKDNHEKAIELIKTMELQKKVEWQQRTESLEQLRRPAGTHFHTPPSVIVDPKQVVISNATTNNNNNTALLINDPNLSSDGERSARIKSPIGSSGMVPLVKTLVEEDQKKEEYEDDFNESAVLDKSQGPIKNKAGEVKNGLDDTEEVEEEYAEDFESSASKSGIKSASGSWLKNSQSLPYEDEKKGDIKQVPQTAVSANKKETNSTSEEEVKEEIAHTTEGEEELVEESADKEANMAEMSISWQPNLVAIKKKPSEDPGDEITEALVQELLDEIKSGSLFPIRDGKRLQQLEQILDIANKEKVITKKEVDNDEGPIMGRLLFNREELARELAEAEESFGDSSSGSFDKRGYADELSPTKLRKKRKTKVDVRISMDNDKFCKEFERKLGDLELLVKTKDREELKRKLIDLQKNVYGEFNLIENFEIRTKDDNEKLMLKSFNEQMKLKILKTIAEAKTVGKAKTHTQILEAVLAKNPKNIEAVKKILLKRASDEIKTNLEIYEKMDKKDKSFKNVFNFCEVNRMEGEEEENLECLDLEELLEFEAEKKRYAEFVFDEVIRDTVAEMERISNKKRSKGK